jgi:hypothetical protein
MPPKRSTAAGETPPQQTERASEDMSTRAADLNERRTYISTAALPFYLATIAGWQDVVNQKQYACYCNMMSGNTLTLMMAVGNGEWFGPVVPFILGTIAHFCASHSLPLSAPHIPPMA